jgi:hypothetical protein
MGVDDMSIRASDLPAVDGPQLSGPLDHAGHNERPSMSRSHYGSRGVTRLSRRRVITIAASVGVGATAVSVAGLSLAGVKPAASDGAPLVISLRDAKKGVFDIFSGGSKTQMTDAKLAAQLLKAVHRA